MKISKKDIDPAIISKISDYISADEGINSAIEPLLKRKKLAKILLTAGLIILVLGVIALLFTVFILKGLIIKDDSNLDQIEKYNSIQSVVMVISIGIVAVGAVLAIGYVIANATLKGIINKTVVPQLKVVDWTKHYEAAKKDFMPNEKWSISKVNFENMNTGNRQNTKYKLFGGYGLFSSKKPPTKSSSDINNTFEVVKDESTMKFEIKTLIEIVERRVNDKVHYDYYTNMDHLLQIDGIKYTTDRLIELLPKKQLKNPTFVPESILFEKKFGIKCDDQMTAAKYFKPLMVEKFSKIEHSIELFQFLKVNGASASTYLYDRKKGQIYDYELCCFKIYSNKQKFADGIAFEILQDLTKFLNTYQFVEPLIG